MNSSFVSSLGTCSGKLRLKVSFPAAGIRNCDAVVLVGSAVQYRPPEFPVFVWIVGVGPEHLAEAEISGIVKAERELLVEVVTEPLVDEHLG
jgi:hypothetical protein